MFMDQREGRGGVFEICLQYAFILCSTSGDMASLDLG